MKWERLLQRSPTLKASIPALLSAGIGVLTGTLVVQITSTNGVLIWKYLFRSSSFYGLALVVLAQILLSRSVYISERNILRFADNEYCIAYLRSKCLPEAAAKYQEMIKNGDGGDFKRAMDEIAEILK